MAKYELPKWQEPTYDMNKLQEQAGQAINPQYDTQLTGITNQRNTATNQFNTGRDQLISDYAKRVANIETDTTLGKNTFANNVNSRGLGRSSIAMGGLEGIGIRGEKRTDETLTERDTRVGDMQSAYDTMLGNLSQQEATIKSNRSTALQDYINQLKEKQYNRARDSYQTEYQRISDLIAKQERQRAYEQQLKQAELDEKYRQQQLKLQKQQLAAQKAAASRKNTTTKNNQPTFAQFEEAQNKAKAEFERAYRSGSGRSWFNNNKAFLEQMPTLYNHVYDKIIKGNYKDQAYSYR